MEAKARARTVVVEEEEDPVLPEPIEDGADAVETDYM
jgi:hypothetical protein